MSDNLKDIKIQLQAWRTSLDTWGLRINVGKTKIFGSSGGGQKSLRNVKYPEILKCLPQDIEILGWYPAGPVLPHGKKVPL